MHPVLKKYLQDKIELTSLQEEIVNKCFILKHARKNEILVPNGAIARHVYFVVKGCLRIFLTGDDGSESTRFLVFEGRMGTAFPSFILKQPSFAAVQSIEDSELLMLSFDDRQSLYKSIPGWETMDRIGLEHEYIASIQRIESFITMDAKSRYKKLLQNNAEIIQRLPNRIVADYLGISQETLSRLKSKK